MGTEELKSRDNQLTTSVTNRRPRFIFDDGRFILPGAEFSAGLPNFFSTEKTEEEIYVDDETIESNIFGTQMEYIDYLKSQGLGVGGNHSAIGIFGPVAPDGGVSAEDQEYIDQAFETKDPIVDKGDGWYSLVYSGDASNSKDSARVYPCDFKLNDNGSIGMRSSERSAYFVNGSPADKNDYEAWCKEAIAEQPDLAVRYEVSDLYDIYGDDAVENRREIELYPDRNDPSQINQVLLQGMYEKEAAKTAEKEKSPLIGGALSQTGNVAETMSTDFLNAQISEQLLGKMARSFSAESSGENVSKESGVEETQRAAVNMSTLDIGKSAQQKSVYSLG